MMWLRYPLSKVLYDIADLIKMFIIPAFLLFIVSESTSLAMTIVRYLFVVFVVLSSIVNLFTMVTFRYRINDQQIEVRKGLFSRTEQIVPLSHIQNVQSDTPFLQRLFGLTTLKLEMLDASDSTITFSSLKIAEAKRITAIVNQEVVSELTIVGTEEKEPPLIFTPTANDLLKATFTSFSFLVIIPLGIKLWNMLDDYNVSIGWLNKLLQSSWFMIPMIIGIAVLAVGIGIIKVFLTYWGYTLRSDATTLYIKKGVLSETKFTITKSRVQAIVYEQSLLKRMLGLVSIKLETTGELTLSETALNEIYPYMPVKQAEQIMQQILPQFVLESPQKKLSLTALWSRLLKPSYLFIIALIVLLYLASPYWYVAFIWPIVLTSYRFFKWRNTRYDMAQSHLQWQQGAFVTERRVHIRATITEVKVTQSAWQRLFGVATIHTVIQAKPYAKHCLKDIPIQEAAQFVTWYKARVNDMTYEGDTVCI